MIVPLLADSVQLESMESREVGITLYPDVNLTTLKIEFENHLLSGVEK